MFFLFVFLFVGCKIMYLQYFSLLSFLLVYLWHLKTLIFLIRSIFKGCFLGNRRFSFVLPEDILNIQYMRCRRNSFCVYLAYFCDMIKYPVQLRSDFLHILFIEFQFGKFCHMSYVIFRNSYHRVAFFLSVLFYLK